MRRAPRILAAAFLAAALAIAAACGGGGEEQTSVAPLGDSSQLLVANPSQALGKSVDRFEENVESVEAPFHLRLWKWTASRSAPTAASATSLRTTCTCS